MFAVIPFSLAVAAGAAAKAVWTTPHDSYSSSVGVLGCKINTNRVAYWPGSVDCNNICVKLSYNGRSVHLLRIDQSGGAYDVSYDAWNYLQTGKPATVDPITGGSVAMEYEEVDASECASLIHTDGHKLPLSASNSINFLNSCLAQEGSWVASNHVLYNICDPICSLGFDETCTLDLAVSNQPSCSHTLGLTTPLASAPVYNVQYDSGKTVVAGSGEAASPGVAAAAWDGGNGGDDSPAAGPSASAQPTALPGIFMQVSSSSIEVVSSVQSTTVSPASADAPTTYPVATPASSSSSSGSGQEIPSSTVLPATKTAQPISSYGGIAASPSSAGKSSTRTYTTLSQVTVSSSPGTTASGIATGSPVPTAGAGHAGGRVSAFALVSSIVVCGILGAF
ncbi:hypothetical protein QBC33DRAFT_549946 [Phialemonium atrogriseum]|uniref:Cerato-platanin n=1 Tax=Phialemonium atrogriseum TaxID=1093897 RepID=A0AAJ0BS95_9PEZI|nr:uncharacterized protein QBC33DRAFT_549946 [Phialemonium atrogriseum]KAK1763336.1 hypothetical protein QBC33DRAFT_549946 [Phialemonium atrogriseum]